MSKIVALALVAWVGLSGQSRADQTRVIVTLTCNDIRDISQWQSWSVIESRIRASGTSEEQIAKARRCLQSSSR